MAGDLHAKEAAVEAKLAAYSAVASGATTQAMALRGDSIGPARVLSPPLKHQNF